VLAAADAAEGEGGMPAELELALQSQQWGALPESGGLLDQPLGLLGKMSAALNVYNAYKSERGRGNTTLPEWTRRNPAAWRTFATIEKMRKNDNGSAE
jgi:hypothetical protein